MAANLDRYVNGSIVVVRDGKRVKVQHGTKFTFTQEEITAADKAQPGMLVKKTDDIQDAQTGGAGDDNNDGTKDNEDGTSGGTGQSVKGSADSSNGQADTGAQATGGSTQTKAPAAAPAKGAAKPDDDL